MAKTISDEQIKLSIIINGNEAQKQLMDLEKATSDLSKETNGLITQRKRLGEQGKKGTAEWDALTKKIKDNTIILDNNKRTMIELQNQIGITGLTMKQLSEKAKLLRMSLVNAVPGSESYKKYTADLDQINGRLVELRGNARTSGSSIGDLADSFNRYQGMALAAVAAFTGVALAIQQIVDLNGKLADAQSDVMKTTGMTKDEVDELTKSFSALHTRTSRMDLLGIAEQGGRIGIAKEDIGDFVNVMNKAAVALGDSFGGGAEEVAEKLGKIKFLFEETKNLAVEQSYNSIGSALNELGANGVASELNIANFTTRIGSLTDVLKPTIQETLALGAAFEESGIESEVSSRAYGIFMKQASTESVKFAKVMGISQQAVEDMVNSNPLDFMLKFAKGMKGMSATDTAKTLDHLGIIADGANKVIGAMGNNTERFVELIDLSNESFGEGISLVKEYDIKNNNLAATLEKISKRISGMFTSEGFVKWLEGAVDWIAKFIGVTEDADGSATAWKNSIIFVAKALAIVTAAMVTNTVWQKLVVLWTTRSAETNLLYIIAAKARAFAEGIGTVATQGYAIATMLMRGNLIGATQAFRVLTVAMMTTPWGFILGAIAAIGTAYVLFSDSAKEAETAQSMLNKTIKDTESIVNQQTISMKNLLAVAQDETATKEARLAAIKKLNEIAPDYLKTLTLENVATAEGKTLIDAYVKSFEKKAMLQVLQKRQAAIMEQMDTKKNLSLEEEATWYDKLVGQIQAAGSMGSSSAIVAERATKRKTAALAELQSQLDLTNAEMNAFLKKNPSVIVEIEASADTSGFNVPGDAEGKDGKGKGKGIKKNPNSSLEEINKIKLDEQSRFDDLYLKQLRQVEDDKIAVMQEGYEKELLIENQRYLREIDDLERKKVHTDELAKLDQDIAKAKEAKDSTKYTALLNIRKGWDQKNADLDAQVNRIKEGKAAIHNDKLGAIQEKGASEALKKRKEDFDQAKTLREIAFNEQLASLGKNERAKEKLRKSFALSELAEEEKFLKELIEQFNVIIGKGNFAKMDMSLLSPEQVESFTKEAAKVGLTLAELIAKKNELTTSEASGDAAALGLGKGATDIFGFTPENWVQFSDNLAAGKFGINEMVFAVSALTDAHGKYNEFLTANENAQLKKYTAASDAKKSKLKKQLDSGVISQTVYNKKVEKIDQDLENKKADLEYKQAKRQRMISAANIIMSTAQAIIGIWAQFPKADFGITAGIMSGVVGALGALQLATVLSTPLPAKGHEAGLYPEYVKREQDGKMFKSKYQGKTRSGLVRNTSHFLVAENGPEMVIDTKAWTQMDPAVKDMLVRDLRGIKGFERGYYKPDVKRSEVPAASFGTAAVSNGNEQIMEMMLAVVSENTTVMKELRDRGVVGKFFKNDLQSAKIMQESINDYNELRTKAKK